MPTTGSQISSLVLKVRSFLNENVQDFWSDADIKLWIQEAKNYVCKSGDFNFMQYHSSIAFASGATSIPKPSDYKKYIKFKLNGSSIDFIDFELWKDDQSSGITEFGDEFIFPIQAQPGTIDLYYYRFIPDIGETSYFSPYYEAILINHAARRGRIKEEMLAPDQVDRLEEEMKKDLDLLKLNNSQSRPPGNFRPLSGL